MNSALKLLIVLLLISAQSKAQKVTLYPQRISQFGKNSDLISMSPVFKLNDNSISSRTTTKILTEKPFSGDRIGYFFLRFNGLEGEQFKNEIVILIEDYTAKSLRIIADLNGNLDFTDDGEVIEWTDQLLIGIPNTNNIEKKFWYQLKRSTISVDNAPRLEKKYATQYSSSEIIPANYWITNQPLALNVSLSTLEDKPITVLLIDNDKDGNYTFNPEKGGDRIAIVEAHLDLSINMIEYLTSSEPIDHNAVFELFDANYQYVKLTDKFLAI